MPVTARKRSSRHIGGMPSGKGWDTKFNASILCFLTAFLLTPLWQWRAYRANMSDGSQERNTSTAQTPLLRVSRKTCTTLRRSAKTERVLFHYNGHGVPRPTNNGEIWVFNSQYTQYIPLSIYDLQSWVGSPVIYVLDCASAGTIVSSFKAFMEQGRREAVSAGSMYFSVGSFCCSYFWKGELQAAAAPATWTVLGMCAGLRLSEGESEGWSSFSRVVKFL